MNKEEALYHICRYLSILYSSLGPLSLSTVFLQHPRYRSAWGQGLWRTSCSVRRANLFEDTSRKYMWYVRIRIIMDHSFATDPYLHSIVTWCSRCLGFQFGAMDNCCHGTLKLTNRRTQLSVQHFARIRVMFHSILHRYESGQTWWETQWDQTSHGLVERDIAGFGLWPLSPLALRAACLVLERKVFLSARPHAYKARVIHGCCWSGSSVIHALNYTPSAMWISKQMSRLLVSHATLLGNYTITINNSNDPLSILLVLFLLSNRTPCYDKLFRDSQGAKSRTNFLFSNNN